MRGPGDFLAGASGEGVRQSGGLSFRFAATCSDSELLSLAAGEAEALLALPESEKDRYLGAGSSLYGEVSHLFENRAENIS